MDDTSAASSYRAIRMARLVLIVSTFAMGACGMIYEYALGVLGNHLMGSSHEQIFVIIGLMMFAMGIGSLVQRALATDLVDWFLGVELLLGLLGGISTLTIFTAFVFTDSYQLVMYLFALAIGLLIGCEIPLLIRINVRFSTSLRENLSGILAMDYVGSLFGALLFTYALLTRFSIEQISLGLGCVNAGLSLLGLIYFWPHVRYRRLLLGSCSVVLVLLGVGWSQGSQWMVQLEQRCFEDPVVYSETSPYQHVVLTQRGDRVRMYLDGHLQFSSQDEAIYHEMLVHVPMMVAPRRERVLILGGGDGLALRDVLRYGDVREVTLVDIDPAVVRLASQHPQMIRLNQAAFYDARLSRVPAAGVGAGEVITVYCRSKRDPLLDQRAYPLADVHVMTVDADLFLRQVQQQYDVIIVDFPDPRSVELAKLFSVQFYQQLRRRMAPGAVASIQSTSPVEGPLVFCCIGRTLEAAGLRQLPYHDHVPSFGEWGWHLAWQDDRTPAAMRRQLADLPPLPVTTQYVTPEVIEAAFVFGKNQRQLLANVDVQASTRLRPVILQYYSQGRP